MLNDAHCHFFSDQLFASLARQRGGTQSVQRPLPRAAVGRPWARRTHSRTAGSPSSIATAWRERRSSRASRPTRARSQLPCDGIHRASSASSCWIPPGRDAVAQTRARGHGARPSRGLPVPGHAPRAARRPPHSAGRGSWRRNTREPRCSCTAACCRSVCGGSSACPAASTFVSAILSPSRKLALRLPDGSVHRSSLRGGPAPRDADGRRPLSATSTSTRRARTAGFATRRASRSNRSSARCSPSSGRRGSSSGPILRSFREDGRQPVFEAQKAAFASARDQRRPTKRSSSAATSTGCSRPASDPSGYSANVRSRRTPGPSAPRYGTSSVKSLNSLEPLAPPPQSRNTCPTGLSRADPSDADLMRRTARGDRDAFGHIYRRYQATIFRFARLMTGCNTAAEDIVQEVFLALMRDASTYSPERASLLDLLVRDGPVPDTAASFARASVRGVGWLRRPQSPGTSGRRRCGCRAVTAR